MKLYHKFRNSSLDTSPLGMICGADNSDSIYTPAGARIVAWTGDNGGHFCQVEGFGDTVFSVDPSASPGDCVHPVARNLPEFIRLVAQCRNAGIVFQAYQWSRTHFEAQISTIRLDYKTRSVLRALENTYHPPVISDPYGYITELQKDFDYTSLPLHPDYFEWCPIRPGAPKWNVGMNTGFADYCESSKAGQELNINRTFKWNSEDWCVPAIYLCENGIIVDSYLEVPCSRIDAYLDKWGNTPADQLSIEDAMLMDLDDPLKMDAVGKLIVNGKDLPRRIISSIVWNPRTENGWKVRRTLEHYELDREKGYLLRRECFLRKSTNPPIRTMDMVLAAEPVHMPGQRFIAPKSGDGLTFTHPITGTRHTITIISQTREALDPNFMCNAPSCYTRLSFSLDPQISRDLFSVMDCDPGDPWNGPKDGPTAVFLTGKVPSTGHSAMSSLRYEPAAQIVWRMVFKQKTRNDVTVPLLP